MSVITYSSLLYHDGVVNKITWEAQWCNIIILLDAWQWKWKNRSGRGFYFGLLENKLAFYGRPLCVMQSFICVFLPFQIFLVCFSCLYSVLVSLLFLYIHETCGFKTIKCVLNLLIKKYYKACVLTFTLIMDLVLHLIRSFFLLIAPYIFLIKKCMP